MLNNNRLYNYDNRLNTSDFSGVSSINGDSSFCYDIVLIAHNNSTSSYRFIQDASAPTISTFTAKGSAAKAAGYTLKELEPLAQKANQLQSDLNEYQKKADYKQGHDTARSRIMEAINAGAGDAAMDIIADNADFFDQPELDEFQKRIEAQKRKDYRERYNEGRQYRKDRKEDSQDAFGARILGG